MDDLSILSASSARLGSRPSGGICPTRAGRRFSLLSPPHSTPRTRVTRTSQFPLGESLVRVSHVEAIAERGPFVEGNDILIPFLSSRTSSVQASPYLECRAGEGVPGSIPGGMTLMALQRHKKFHSRGVVKKHEVPSLCSCLRCARRRAYGVRLPRTRHPPTIAC